MAIHTTFERASRTDTIWFAARRGLAGDLRTMAQHVENASWSKFLTAVAIIVAAQIILAAIGAGIGSYMAISKMELENCYTNQRIDALVFPHSPPRDCR